MSAHPTWLAGDVLPEALIARIRGALHDLDSLILEANKWIAEHGQVLADVDAATNPLPDGVWDAVHDQTGYRALTDRLAALVERLRDVERYRDENHANAIAAAGADYELAVAVGGHSEPGRQPSAYDAVLARLDRITGALDELQRRVDALDR